MTRPSCPSRAASTIAPVSPTTAGTMAMRALSAPGHRGSGAAGRPPAVNRTDPPATTPSGAPRGARKVSTSPASVFRASRPLSTVPCSTTMVPRPRLSDAPATRALSTRLRRPSHSSSSEVRMAPVRTTGMVGSRVRASRYAVSSRVSVPWVTTMPRTEPRGRHFGQAVPERPEPVEPKMRRREAPPVFHRHRADGGEAGSQAHQRRPIERRDRPARLGGLAHGDRAAGEEEVDHAGHRLNRTARSRR